jgi:hypothetical protein
MQKAIAKMAFQKFGMLSSKLSFGFQRLRMLS